MKEAKLRTEEWIKLNSVKSSKNWTETKMVESHAKSSQIWLVENKRMCAHQKAIEKSSCGIGIDLSRTKSKESPLVNTSKQLRLNGHSLEKKKFGVNGKN